MTTTTRALAAVVALAVVGAAWWAGRRASAPCAVGVSGTDATITVKGLGAVGACRQLRTSDSTWLYDRSETPEGDVICEKQHGRNRYIVRDRGLLMVVGRSLCAWLNDPEAAAPSVQAAMRSDLRNLVTAEEAFFADSQRYTANRAVLGLTAGDTLLHLSVSHDGFRAVIGTPRARTTCAIFVGSVAEPPATREGEPACR